MLHLYSFEVAWMSPLTMHAHYLVLHTMPCHSVPPHALISTFPTGVGTVLCGRCKQWEGETWCA